LKALRQLRARLSIFILSHPRLPPYEYGVTFFGVVVERFIDFGTSPAIGGKFRKRL
jgi:hypothetical protein